MKEFKGSNFLLLFVLLIDIVYAVPPTISYLNHEHGTSVESGIALLSVVLHLFLYIGILLIPFLGQVRNINWGEDVCTKKYASQYNDSGGITYRFSIILLVAYLFYQPVKKIITWTDKYLTIKLKDDD